MSNAGRPPHYETPEEFDAKVEEYFAQISESGNPVTISGLAYFMGFCDRASLYDYEKRPGFSHSVKRARLAVEHGYEIRLNGNAPTGAIFALKNMGWKDKTEQEHSGPGGGPIQTQAVTFKGVSPDAD